MSVGNITPRSAALSLSGMLLGAETYPSSLQQALAQNTGWLVYRPIAAHNFMGSATIAPASGTNHVPLGYLFCLAGNYDTNIRLSCASDSTAVSVWLQVGSTIVSSVLSVSAGTTITDTKTGAAISAGWQALDLYVAGGLQTLTYTEVTAMLKQYT
jgi:hypothetical protein